MPMIKRSGTLYGFSVWADGRGLLDLKTDHETIYFDFPVDVFLSASMDDWEQLLGARIIVTAEEGGPGKNWIVKSIVFDK